MFSLVSEHAQRTLTSASTLTYGGTTTAVLFWGLQVSDIGVIVSSLASICGVGIQFYVAISRVRATKSKQETLEDGKDPE